MNATKAPRKKRTTKSAAVPKPEATPASQQLATAVVGNGVALMFEGERVRITPNGQIVAIDILKALG